MPDETVREIAQAIANELLINKWQFYLLLALITSAVSGISVFFAGFLRRRGENYATAADFDALIVQLRQTTDAAERVRTEIAHTDWATKEWKTIRRVKIEELFIALYDIKRWFKVANNHYLFSDPQPDPSPLPKLIVISKLYFPELEIVLTPFRNACDQYELALMSAKSRLLPLYNDHEAKMALLDTLRVELMDPYALMLRTSSSLEERLPDLLATTISPNNSSDAQTSTASSTL